MAQQHAATPTHQCKLFVVKRHRASFEVHKALLEESGLPFEHVFVPADMVLSPEAEWLDGAPLMAVVAEGAEGEATTTILRGREIVDYARAEAPSETVNLDALARVGALRGEYEL